MNKKLYIVGVLALVALSVFAYISYQNNSTLPNEEVIETGKPLAYGDVTLELNELAQFDGISIRPLSIEEDSRCPVDVQCIQAGTVRVNVEIKSNAGSKIALLELADAFIVEGKTITLASVLPLKNSKVTVADAEYRLMFRVVLQNPSVAPVQGKCYVGGCSAQLCTDKPDAVSTCEYRDEYACYQSAKCERQSNGQCRWTPTATLNACLSTKE